MTIREFYTLVGGSYDDMSERFPSDALILRFLTMLPQDGSMELLARSVDAADTKSAFRAVHTLKGVALNLGLTALAGVCSEMTEALRGSDTLPASAPALFGLTRGFWEALPAWVLPVLCLALIFLTAPCADGVTTQTPQLWLFGFTTPDFASADYFPLLPWFFVFLLGTWAGRYVKAGRLPQWFYTAKAPRLALVGRHALLLYVLHQPLLYALTMLLRLIFIR